VSTLPIACGPARRRFPVLRGALLLGGATAANWTRSRTSLRAIALRFFCVQLSVNSRQPSGSRSTEPVLQPAASIFRGQRVTGGRGRIRTSVARKERQIYSLLVLATHPPVLEIIPHANYLYQELLAVSQSIVDQNTKRTRVRRHQPVDFPAEDSLPPHSPQNFLVELAEGIEPPTL
jgi:hypothetical protein